MFDTGLVIGKFYPPHLGHKHLLDVAQSQSHSVIAIICERDDQTISGRIRADWLKEIHPDIEVIVVKDILADDDSQAWADYVKHVLGRSPDAVFTSEDYGDPFAHFLGCKHISVDKRRLQVPISASSIRAHPLKFWDYLEPCVRAYFAVRVCIVGAESTGTTSMAQALAENYHTVWVPEYGREYSEVKMIQQGGYVWISDEFLHIALEQIRREDQMARQANRLLICDTDPLATAIWHLRYMGTHSQEVQKVAGERTYAHYFVTDVDIPFIQDGFRDGEHIRQWMHKEFLNELESLEKPFSVLSGSHEQRLVQAVSLIDSLLDL
jgi:HTH-type transcriptional repressor of NAD biosynthesis genes